MACSSPVMLVRHFSSLFFSYVLLSLLTSSSHISYIVSRLVSLVFSPPHPLPPLLLSLICPPCCVHHVSSLFVASFSFLLCYSPSSVCVCASDVFDISGLLSSRLLSCLFYSLLPLLLLLLYIHICILVFSPLPFASNVSCGRPS